MKIKKSKSLIVLFTGLLLGLSALVSEAYERRSVDIEPVTFKCDCGCGGK